MNSDMVTARTLAKALRVAWCPGSSAIEQDYEMIAAALRAALEAAGYEFDKSTGGEGIVIISRMIRAAYGERGDAE